MNRPSSPFVAGLAAAEDDPCGPGAWGRVVGGTVEANGSNGTDHGHGSCLFVLGDVVRGRRVHGALPPLERDALFEGRDLPVTTDFRSVFAAVAGDHLGVTDTARLFPGWGGRPLALFE